jgi:phospholipid-translocating ATPase
MCFFYFSIYSVIFERLSYEGRLLEAKTKEHVKKYAEAGLRTMLLAYRELGEGEYGEWEAKFSYAKETETADRDVLMDEIADKIERDLILLGATAIEDKLQKGVCTKLKECIT